MKFGLLVFFAANTLAAPFWVLNENLPRAEVKEVGCTSSRFNQGQTFVYDYEGETLNKVEGATPHQTGLQLRARISIMAMDECKFNMQISNAELLQQSKNQEAFSKSADSASFMNAMEKYNLMFSMSGNQISGLFSNVDEPTYILNIKRGILSTIQLDETVNTETDVNGICATTFETKDGKIIKSKKLSDCSDRVTQEVGMQTATFKSEGGLKVLDSDSECVYTMSGKQIDVVVCKESHLFRPFSAGYKSASGAMTLVKQTMTLAKVKSGKRVQVKGDNKEESTILFDHSTEEQSATNNMKDEFEQIMDRLVNPTKDGQLSVKQDSAHEFSAMVFLLRKMDDKRMKRVWNKYFDCIESQLCKESQFDLRDVYRQYLLDGIAYCGTSTCISTVHNVIIRGEITGERMNIFLQSIALVAKTTKKMIRDVIDIATKQPSRQVYLTLGTLISRHCEKTPTDCLDDKRNAVTQAEDFLTGKLGQSCEGQDNHERVEEILMALKGIGNAKRPQRASSVIVRCAITSIHSNITKAAFDALRGMSCEQGLVDELFHFVRDNTNVPEKRIPAFVALMKCPTEVVLDHVVHILQDEPSNQFASFIWSYLTNIMESSDPKHNSTKTLLEKLNKIKTLRKVDLSVHQFSRAYEKSIHMESMNSGATAEGHVVFDHENYFPKSAFFDLTANVLGVPLQLVEANVGVEGLEELLEQVTEAEGFPAKNWMFNMFNFTMTAQKFREMAQKRENVNHRLRRAAGAEDNISELHAKVNKRSARPNGHLSFKVMGQEIRAFSYDDIFSMIDQIDNMNVIQLLLNVAKGGHKTFTKSMMFLEMTQTVPTGVGLPLRMKLVGSTVASVELDGKFDIRNMFWGPGSLTIKGYVKPSAVVEITGQMGVDGHFASAGVYVNSSLFVSNIMKGNIIYDEGKMLKINMDVPEEAIELFNVGSTPFMYLNGQSDAIEGVSRKINPDEFCLKSVMVGHGVCANFRLPVAFREYEAPYFPLSGPAYFGVKLIRADQLLTTYQFLMSLTKKQTTTTGKIEFSTPQATYDRKLGGNLVYSDVDNTKTLTLSTEKSGKGASVMMSYNTMTHESSVVGKNNIFTKKDIVTKLSIFNKTNSLTNQQYGLTFLTEYDWYKFEHISEFVRQPTGYKFQSLTVYYPEKSVNIVYEYNTEEKKLSGRYSIGETGFELNGQLENKGEESGITIVVSSLTSDRTTTFYTGFINTAEKKAIITTAIGFGKNLKNVLKYENINGLQSVENVLTADRKVAQLRGELTSTNKMSTMLFKADFVGKTAVTKLVFINTEAVKELKVTANAAGKSAQASIKHVVKADGPSFTADIDIMGRKANAFINVNTNEGYKTTVGAVVGKYVAGIRGSYTNTIGHVKSVCSSMYYGTTEAEKEPLVACMSLHSLGKSYIHNKAVISLKMNQLNKHFEMVHDLEKHIGHMSYNIFCKYNGVQYARKKISLKYKEIQNSELEVSLKITKYVVAMKWFSKKSGEETHVGFKSTYMDKSLMLLNRYVSAVVGRSTETRMITELIHNGNVLPVSTEMSYLSGEESTGPSVKLIVGKYSFAYSTLISKTSGSYQWGVELSSMRETDELFKLYKSTIITASNEEKSLHQKFGTVVFGKTYEYGWEANYKNIGTPKKSAYAVTFRVQYATKRKSSITYTFSNSKTKAEVIVDLEYIPGKSVAHYVTYSKVNRQLDVSFEFLPKMFTRFMARLDKANGYSVVTDMTVQWKGFKSSIGVVNGYTNTATETTISTTIGKDVSFSASYMKSSPKRFELSATVFKYNGKLVTVFSKTNIQSRFILNEKTLLSIGSSYDLETKIGTFAISNDKKKLFQLTSNLNELKNKLDLTVSGVKQWVSVVGKVVNDELVFSVSGKKQWISLTSKLNRKQKEIQTEFSVLGKEYLKLVTAMPNNMVTVNVVSPYMVEKTFIGEIEPSTKSLTVSCRCSSSMITGMTLRGDYINMLMSAEFFSNKNKSGFEVFVENNSLVTRLALTNELAIQTTFEVQDDNILKVTVQNKAGNKYTNQTAFQYKLSQDMSQFALNWNKNTVRKVIDTITPIVESMVKDAEIVSEKALTASRNFLTQSMSDAQKASFYFLNNLEKSFDEVDFNAARQKVGTVTVDALRKLAAVVRKSMLKAARSLESLKENLPQLVHQAKLLSENAQELIKETQEMLKKMKVDLNTNWEEASLIVIKVVSNITESSRPVVVKAIELVKGFKIKGKTVVHLVEIVQNKGQVYLELYTKKAAAQFKILKTQGVEIYNKGTKYLLKIELPYSGTIGELLEIIIKKASVLKKEVVKKTTELKKKIAGIDMKETMDKITVTIMDYKIQGKSIKKHIVVFKKDLKKLPENTRVAITNLLKMIQQLSKMSNEVYNNVATFSAPLTQHIKLVRKSVHKHFSPLLSKSMKKMMSKLQSIQWPTIQSAQFFIEKLEMIEQNILPLIKPIVPLYESLKKQIKNMKVNGFRVEPLFNMQMSMLTEASQKYMKQINKNMEEQIENLNNAITEFTTMTPEQIVDRFFDLSSVKGTQAVKYLNKMVAKREQMMKDTMQKIKSLYNKLKSQYNKMTSESIEEVMESFIHGTSEGIINTADELATLLKQLADMDISTPTSKAWENADVLGNLERYGVNNKVRNFIKLTKDVNITKIVLKTMNKIQKFVADIYGSAFIRAIKVYGKMEKIYDYIRSIPKKEYEQWFQELKRFTLKNQEEITSFFTKLVPEKCPFYGFNVMYNIMKKTSKVNMEKIYSNYVTPAKEWTMLVREKSQLVYNDIKEPNIRVFKHYNEIVSKFVNENFDVLQGQLMEQYMKINKEMKVKFSELKTKLNELKVQLQNKYEVFLQTYGDMTWEEISDETYKYGKQTTKSVRKSTKKLYKNVKKICMKYQEKSKKLYQKSILQINQYIKYLVTEIKPKVIKTLKNYKAKVEAKIKGMKLKLNENLIIIKSQVMSFYNINKDKTLKQLYTEVKKVVTEEFIKQYNVAETFAIVKANNMKTLSNTYITKIDVLVRTVIIPELKAESESFINQTLRSSVILANETIKAYYPHYVLAKDTIGEFAETVKTKVAAISNKVSNGKMMYSLVLQENIQKLWDLLKELVQKLQNHEMYKKTLNHEFVVKSTTQLKEIVKTAKMKVEEIRSHQNTLEYKLKTEELISQVKQNFDTIKQALEKYSKHPNVASARQMMNQLQKSGMFTVNKFVEMTLPQFQTAAAVLVETIDIVQTEMADIALAFRQKPEVTFWVVMEVTKEVGKYTYATISSVDKKMIKNSAARYVRNLSHLKKTILEECFDEWTKQSAQKLYKSVKKIVEKADQRMRAFPAQAKDMILQSYEENMVKINTLYAKQMSLLVAAWDNSPYRAFVTNQLWKELKDEVMSHELVVFAQTLAVITQEKFVKLKEKSMNELKTKNVMLIQKLTEMKEKFQIKYSDMKVKAVEKFEQMVAQYNSMVEKYNNKYKQLLTKAQKFVEETTISDIVGFTKEKYEEVVANVEETKMKIRKMNVKYTAKAKQLYAKYHTKVVAMYKEYETKGKEAFVKVYAKSEVLVMKYKSMMMPYYKKYEAQFMAAWNKHYPIVIAKYNELYSKAELKYIDLKAKSLELFEEYKEQVVTFSKKTAKKAEKKWMESEVRAQLMAIKRMTIRDTIESLKKLPMQAKSFAIATLDNYQTLAVAYQKQAFEQFQQRYNMLVKELMEKKEIMTTMLKPYTTPAVAVYLWIDNEVKETGLFVYRYYNLAEKYTNAKTLVNEEYKRMIPLVKAYAETSKILVKQYTKVIGKLANEKAAEYKDRALDYGVKYSSIAGHEVLKGVHSILRYVDNINVREMQDQAKTTFRDSMTELTKFISFDSQKGEILITIPHGEITPSFSHHIKKIGNRARRSIDTVKLQGKDLIEKINKQLVTLEMKVGELKAQLKQIVMNNTVELRSDLAFSYKMNKKLTDRIMVKVKVFAQKRYRQVVDAYKSLKSDAKKMMTLADVKSKKYYKLFMKMSRDAYLKAGIFFWDLYENPRETYATALQYSIKNIRIAKTKSMKLYQKYKPSLISGLRSQQNMLKERAEFVSNVLSLIYSTMHSAVNDWRSGMSAEKAFYPILRQTTFATNFLVFENLNVLRRSFCREDPKICKYLKESIGAHSSLINKYLGRAENMLTSRQLETIRAFRQAVRSMTNMKSSLVGSSYPVTAMIFGKNHIISFDKKMYDFVDYNQRECTYMLAHDFKDGKFSIMSQEESIIVRTPEMTIKIKSDGKTKTNIGGKTTTSLPVESESNKCIRLSNVIKCEFMNQGVFVKVDLSNFLATIQLSSWHFGKTQGLLGTNNRESYDDWRMPNGETTDNIYKFANAYEMTGKRACKVQPKTKPVCKKTASPRCDELFKSSSSVFARFFSLVDPTPFLKACKSDTSACVPTSHCSSAAAYSAMVQASGEKTVFCPRCVKIESHQLNDEWKEKSKHAVDVVLMLSEQQSLSLFKKQIMKVMIQVEQKMRIKQYKTRYTVIGFGGQGVHENAHIHPIGTGDDVFGNVKELTKEVKSMDFDGENTNNNDAYDAIIMASRLPFRPGASRVFILYNNEEQKSSLFGATKIEAQRYLTHQANASLFVFENFNLLPLAQQLRGKFIGETSQKVYTDKSSTGTTKPSQELLNSSFKSMTERSEGGLFTTKFTSVKLVAKSLYDAMSYNLQRVDSQCQQCKLDVKLSGDPKAICVSRNDIQC